MNFLGVALIVACVAWLSLEIVGLVKKIKEYKQVKREKEENNIKEDKP